MSLLKSRTRTSAAVGIILIGTTAGNGATPTKRGRERIACAGGRVAAGATTNDGDVETLGAIRRGAAAERAPRDIFESEI